MRALLCIALLVAVLAAPALANNRPKPYKVSGKSEEVGCCLPACIGLAPRNRRQGCPARVPSPCFASPGTHAVHAALARHAYGSRRCVPRPPLTHLPTLRAHQPLALPPNLPAVLSDNRGVGFDGKRLTWTPTDGKLNVSRSLQCRP